MSRTHPRETHRSNRVGWLRAAVLGANDGIVSVAGLVVGVAAGGASASTILATGIARMRDPGKFHIVGAPFSVEPLAIMLNKESPAFKKMFDAQIASLSSNGELAKIYDKWFMQPIPPNGITVNLPASDNTKAAWKNLTDKPMEAYQTAQQ